MSSWPRNSLPPQQLFPAGRRLANPDRFIQMASAAEDAGVALGETSIRELRTLLTQRIAHDRRRGRKRC